MSHSRKNSLQIKSKFDQSKLTLTTLLLEERNPSEKKNKYGTYLDSHTPLEPLSPLSPLSPTTPLSPEDYGSYHSLLPMPSSTKQKLALPLYSLFSTSKTPHEDKEENIFEINVSQKIFFTQKDQIDNANLYLNSHVFTAKGQIFIVNKAGKITPKMSVNQQEITEALASITQKYTLLSPYYPILIEFFTWLPPELSLLIKNYLTIDESTPLNNQLSSFELKKLSRLINTRFCNMAAKDLGIDINSHSIERVFYSGITKKAEPGPFYERITGKGITALNIKFYEINIALNKLNKSTTLKTIDETPEDTADTLFIAYKKRFNTKAITRENLDLFIEELPSDHAAWLAFKQFYHASNMIYLNEQERLLYELQFTSDGLATLSKDHPQQLFDEKQFPIGGRMLANTINKSNQEEIHGKNTAIYVFHQEKILIARDKLAQFHHSSFADDGVQCAGTLRISTEGKILMISNESGHYRPSERRFHNLLKYLMKQNALTFLEELKITRRILVKNNLDQVIGTAIQPKIFTDKEKIQNYLQNIFSKLEKKLKHQLLNDPNSPLARARIALKKRHFEHAFEAGLNDIRTDSIGDDQPPPLELSFSKNDIEPETVSPITPSHTSFSSRSSISSQSFSSTANMSSSRHSISSSPHSISSCRHSVSSSSHSITSCRDSVSSSSHSITSCRDSVSSSSHSITSCRDSVSSSSHSITSCRDGVSSSSHSITSCRDSVSSSSPHSISSCRHSMSLSPHSMGSFRHSMSPSTLASSPIEFPNFNKKPSFSERKHSASSRRPMSLSPLSPLSPLSENNITFFKMPEKEQLEQMPELEELEHAKPVKKSFFQRFKDFSFRKHLNNSFKKKH